MVSYLTLKYVRPPHQYSHLHGHNILPVLHEL